MTDAHGVLHSKHGQLGKQEPGLQQTRQPTHEPLATTGASLTFLQAVAGNQAVNGLLQRTLAARAPATIQRTIWVKNIISNQIEAVAAGPSTFALPIEALRFVLEPGDRYDESTGVVTRLSGEQVSLTTFAPTPTQTAPAPMLIDRPEQNRPDRRSVKALPNARELTERRRQQAQDVSSKAREDSAAAAREEPVIAQTPMQAQTEQSTGQPEVVFQAGEEMHRVFPTPSSSGWRLMVESIPLPIADFILEMETRFNALKTLAENKKVTIKPLRGLAGSVKNFADNKVATLLDLTAANNVFANLLSTHDQKRIAEEKLAARLHKMIEQVKQLANRFGKHSNTPGYTSPPTAADFYLKQMYSAFERYRVEGLVARYEEQPDYEGSDFERDHQPHNDLIENMAKLPEFAGTKMVQVAAGRTLKGWSIMLHHARHSAGRTYGNKGGQVTAQFLLDLAAHKSVPRSVGEVRTFCVDYLITSLKADVAAMKLVAGDLNNYSDLDAPAQEKIIADAKNAGNPIPDALAIQTETNNIKLKVQKQILDGEDRMLNTEDAIKSYDK